MIRKGTQRACRRDIRNYGKRVYELKRGERVLRPKKLYGWLRCMMVFMISRPAIDKLVRPRKPLRMPPRLTARVGRKDHELAEVEHEDRTTPGSMTNGFRTVIPVLFFRAQNVMVHADDYIDFQ